MRSKEDLEYLHDILHYLLFDCPIADNLREETIDRKQMRAVHDAICWLIGTGDHAEQEFIHDMNKVEFAAKHWSDSLARARSGRSEPPFPPSRFDRALFSSKKASA